MTVAIARSEAAPPDPERTHEAPPRTDAQHRAVFEAYAYASRFRLRIATTWLPPTWTLTLTRGQLVARGPDGERVLLFAFGALVFVGVDAATRDAVLAQVWHALEHEPHAPLRESSVVLVRPRLDLPRFSFDSVVLVPRLDDPVVEVLARGLAQSVCLDYYDEDVQGMLDRVGTAARDLGHGGRFTAPSRDLLRFVGAAMASQLEILGGLMLLDKPEGTWEDELADQTHRLLRQHLELDERYAALQAKLDAARQSMLAVLELISSRRALWLETVVVLLIAVEIVMGLARLH